MKEKLNIPMRELTVEEIERIGEDAGPLQRVHLGGGEPMIRRDIAEKAVCVANTWDTDVVCIPTNGWHTEAILRVIRYFGEHSKKTLRLHFSINALGDEMDEFTGIPHSFLQWETSVHSALQCAKEYSNVTIVGLVTFGAYNRERLAEIKRYLLDSIGVHDYSLQLVRAHRGYEPVIPIEEFSEHLHSYFQHESPQRPFLRAYRELVREYSHAYYQHPGFVTRCRAGGARVVMSPDGDVYPCERLGYPNGGNPERWLLGNIRDHGYSLKHLLRTSRAKQIRSDIAASRCHCDSGIDLALNLACSARFKIAVLFRGVRYGVKRLLA